MSWKSTRRAFAVAAIAVVLAAQAGIARAQTGPADGPVARTTGGLVRGSEHGGVQTYQRIPYAAPPTGARRWWAPAPASSWPGVRDATRPALPCAQGAIVDGGYRKTSENCLYLNLTRPAKASKRRPVMVWMHGGGFTSGAGTDYDPARMAVRGGVVVVTVDFRLGVFGFYGQHGLPGSGTFGLQDQQAALRWVRANAASFGGDPGNVTLFGESGGAVGTCAQLTSPASAGLFEKAIMESGSCHFEWPRNGVVLGAPGGSFWHPAREVAATGHRAAATLHCARQSRRAELDCMRGLSAHALDDVYARFDGPAYGTPTLPLNPRTAMRVGAFHRVPVISGHNRDEQRLTAGVQELLGRGIERTDYARLIRQGFGAKDAAAIRRVYPLHRFDGYGKQAGAIAWSAVYTDRMWVCTQLSTTAALARGVPTYSYEFADEHARPITVDMPADFPAGAPHSSELPNLFDVTGKPRIGGDAYTPAQRALSRQMVGYWTSFARTGDPNHAGAPRWSRASTLRLAPGAGKTVPVDDVRNHHCRFWQRLARS